jgi:SAM-dependent methyltransferase
VSSTARWTLDLERWDYPASDDELAVLDAVTGPVLEIGCGPGRLVAALAARGVPALGIDVTNDATRRAARNGAPVLQYSVFDRIPGEGRWPTVLVFDGSIGIGGDPARLLARAALLLAPRGVVIAEVDAPGRPSTRGSAALGSEDELISQVPWASIGMDDIVEVAARAGLRVERATCRADRWFVWLAPA